MDPEVFQLISKIASSGQALEKQVAIDATSPDARQTRRDLLYTSRRLANQLQNEGQIVEGYLYGVCHTPDTGEGGGDEGRWILTL